MVRNKLYSKFKKFYKLIDQKIKILFKNKCEKQLKLQNYQFLVIKILNS